MRGRCIYADVPHDRDPTRWLEPLLLGSNVALFAAQFAVTPTAKHFFRESFVPEAESNRPLIYITWHRFNYLCMSMFLEIPREVRPTMIAHDGVASRFTYRAAAWMGHDIFVFRRRSKVAPRQQIADYIRATGRPILNLPDSGGPYGVMKPGVLEIARACNARIVPFQLDPKPAVSVGRTLRHAIPVPFARVTVRRGTPLDGTATVEECQRALDALA